MAWTVPKTWTANTRLTATELNTYIRDNQNEMEPAKATTLGRHFVSTAANAIAERETKSAVVSTVDTTTSTVFTDLDTTIGPSVSITTGTKALVMIACRMSNGSAGARNVMSYNPGASDNQSIIIESVTSGGGFRMMLWDLKEGLTAGTNSFTAKYRVTGGTGSFIDRQMTIFAL